MDGGGGLVKDGGAGFSFGRHENEMKAPIDSNRLEMAILSKSFREEDNKMGQSSLFLSKLLNYNLKEQKHSRN